MRLKVTRIEPQDPPEEWYVDLPAEVHDIGDVRLLVANLPNDGAAEQLARVARDADVQNLMLLVMHPEDVGLFGFEVEEGEDA